MQVRRSLRDRKAGQCYPSERELVTAIGTLQWGQRVRLDLNRHISVAGGLDSNHVVYFNEWRWSLGLVHLKRHGQREAPLAAWPGQFLKLLLQLLDHERSSIPP